MLFAEKSSLCRIYSINKVVVVVVVVACKESLHMYDSSHRYTSCTYYNNSTRKDERNAKRFHTFIWQCKSFCSIGK